MKTGNSRFFAVLLLSAFCCSTTHSWARLPKPIQVRGVIVFVDQDTKSLVFKGAKNKKALVLDWDKDTQFVKCGDPIAATALTNTVAVVIHYKDLSFRNPLLKKVIWTEGEAEK